LSNLIACVYNGQSKEWSKGHNLRYSEEPKNCLLLYEILSPLPCLQDGSTASYVVSR
jgi:hypothetical protein